MTVLGVNDRVGNVSLNGVQVPQEGISWNETSKALMVTGLKDLMARGAWKEEWVLRWG